MVAQPTSQLGTTREELRAQLAVVSRSLVAATPEDEAQVERLRPIVEKAVAITRGYVLDDPRKHETTLGPMVRTAAADFVRVQIAEAVAQGARAHIEESLFEKSVRGTPYLAPQLLTHVDHGMRVIVTWSVFWTNRDIILALADAGAGGTMGGMSARRPR